MSQRQQQLFQHQQSSTARRQQQLLRRQQSSTVQRRQLCRQQTRLQQVCDFAFSLLFLVTCGFFSSVLDTNTTLSAVKDDNSCDFRNEKYIFNLNVYIFFVCENKAILYGGIVGGAVLLILIVITVVCVLRRRGRGGSKEQQNNKDSGDKTFWPKKIIAF